jgi:hypothetical protein
MHRLRALILTALVTALFAAAYATMLPTTVQAQDPPEGQPTCAVTGYGPVACPVGGEIAPGNGCWVRDPSAPKPKWDKVAPGPQCKHPAFTPPQAIDCTDKLTPDNDRNKDGRNDYCDQALQCAGDDPSTPTRESTKCDLMAKYINPLIKALSALVGIGVTVSIIMAGIQYMTSADDSQKVSAAKRRILVALLTLGGYFVFYQFLRWIVPGNSF